MCGSALPHHFAVIVETHELASSSQQGAGSSCSTAPDGCNTCKMKVDCPNFQPKRSGIAVF